VSVSVVGVSVVVVSMDVWVVNMMGMITSCRVEAAWVADVGSIHDGSFGAVLPCWDVSGSTVDEVAKVSIMSVEVGMVGRRGLKLILLLCFFNKCSMGDMGN